MGPNLSWLVVSTPLKNMKVIWDDDIPNIWENKIDVPNHQPVRLGGPQMLIIRDLWDDQVLDHDKRFMKSSRNMINRTAARLENSIPHVWQVNFTPL